jgi:hypothetical protein
MESERVAGPSCDKPFPVYEDLVETLISAHGAAGADRDPAVAHVLGTCAGYSYADADTVATMMARLGLANHACVRVGAAVPSMLVFSTAYILQSACGRVVIVSYRGTEGDSLGNWLGDAEVGTEWSGLSVPDATETVRVHAGFHRNVRTTWLPILEELNRALQGQSLLNHQLRVTRPLEALYVTGHSLGGAMALLFALRLCGNPAYRALFSKLRAVYTFGQPLTLAGPLPKAVAAVVPRVFRHVTPGDPIPALPPALWGALDHVGHEYRYAGGQWQHADAPTAQMDSLREVPRALLAFLAKEKDRASFRYAMGSHGAHQYLDALRPRDRVTEYGDIETSGENKVMP